MACGAGKRPTLAEHMAQPVLATGMWKGYKYEARSNPGSCRFCDLRQGSRCDIGDFSARERAGLSCVGYTNSTGGTVAWTRCEDVDPNPL